MRFQGFAEAVTAVERSHDFVVVDTPGTDSYLTRLAHSMADTLITPLNDSFVDLDVRSIRAASAGQRRAPSGLQRSGGRSRFTT
jgi:cellulose biosynthesis protein BcsQ